MKSVHPFTFLNMSFSLSLSYLRLLHSFIPRSKLTCSTNPVGTSHRRIGAVKFGDKTFLPENICIKINKMPEFYMIFARKNIFPKLPRLPMVRRRTDVADFGLCGDRFGIFSFFFSR